MSPEHWQQAKQIYLDALECDASARAALLNRLCAADPALRREVESLLANQTEAEKFLEQPVLNVAAQVLADDTTTANLPERIGAYQVLRRIGAGGMGEVYLAKDTRLGRNAALKLLPAQFTTDRELVQRFEQEARAASSLNHPNIITIYEIGQTDATHFIAAEFVEGLTLRQRLKQERLALLDALDILVQIAGALAAAHEAGIVHRDIKPENVMIRRDGYVKVLDFGLAKLTERQRSEFATRAVNEESLHTKPGVVMGTLAYMSPEQARGLEVDARTDIFSLGVLSYELFAGQRPFAGSSGAEVIAAVLHTEPPALTQLAPHLPATLAQVINKMLSKERTQRYQQIGELLTELKAHKRQLEFQAELARASEGASAKVKASDETLLDTITGIAGDTRANQSAHTTSAAELLLSELKHHKPGVALAALALLVIVAGAGFWFYKLINQRQTSEASASFQTMKFTRLTATGKATRAALSPDGKYVAYVMGAPKQQSLWLKHLATGSDKEIVPPNGIDYGDLTFSRDGSYLYYNQNDLSHDVLYQVPLLGGAEKKLSQADVDSALALSPDGKRFAFVRGDPLRGEAALIVARADGTGEQKLVTGKISSFFTPRAWPSWSPDGETIALALRRSESGNNAPQIVAVRVKDGVATPVTARPWVSIGALNWLADGRGLIITAVDQESAPAYQIWQVAYPGGAARRITNDLQNYRDVSLTADSSALVSVQTARLSNIWLAPQGEAQRASQITSNQSDGYAGLAWSPAGKLVYASAASGNPDIWLMNADGSGQKQLTAESSADIHPAVTPDGRYVLFLSDRSGKPNIWRMEIDGRNPTQLTYGEVRGYCSADNQWVVYSLMDSGKGALWKVSINGGNPAPLTDYPVSTAVLSPDGSQIAFRYIDPQANKWKVAVIPAAGGAPSQTYEIPRLSILAQQIGWLPDGRALTYIDAHAGIFNLWSQPLDGSPPKQLTDFKSDLIFAYAWSRDGKQLAVARGTQTSDVVLINGFK